MLIWCFSNNLDIYNNVGKLTEQHFSVRLFSNPGDNILLLLKLNEARISEQYIQDCGVGEDIGEDEDSGDGEYHGDGEEYGNVEE